MIRYIYFLVLFILIKQTTAQTTKAELFNQIEKAGGVHFAYPEHEISSQSPVPDGYIPFYMSHLGRHGSRYLISDTDYKSIIDIFERAAQKNELTPLGREVLGRLNLLWREVQWRGGDLSPRGVREQRGIASRLYGSYPELFGADSKVTACATTVVRCVLSMDAFCERIKEFSPETPIDRNAGEKWQRFLNHHTKQAIAYRSAEDTWKPEYNKFEKAHVKPQRMMAALFTNSKSVEKEMKAEKIMWGLFAIAEGMQNVETKISFFDIFTKDELVDLWQCKNLKTYLNDGNSALSKGIMMENAKPLLRSILDSSAQIIANGGRGADFRFAHDGNIIPLAMLLHLKGCYSSVSDANKVFLAWSDFKVAPMAGNIQFVFFRKKDGNPDDILVKILLHENEITVPPVKTVDGVHYRWKDLRQFYESLL